MSIKYSNSPQNQPSGGQAPGVNDWLVKINNGTWSERALAAQKLAAAGPNAVDGLTRALQSKRKEVRYAATWALGEIGGEQVINTLCRALNDPDWSVREVAARALGDLGDLRATDTLSKAAKLDKVKSVRCAALNSIDQLLNAS